MSRQILSTLHYPARRRWVEEVDMVGPDLPLARRLRRIVSDASRYRVVVLDGSSRADPLAAAAIARLRRPPRVVIVDATWKLGERALDRATARLGLRALDGPHVTYCVFSSAEAERFPRTWGVDPARVRFVPWHYTLSDAELEIATREDGGVFAGGNSARDYDALIAAAARLDAAVTIATSSFRPSRIPSNVTVGPVSPQRFTELTAAASVVVVALEDRRDRSAGQGTYLNAMALGKTVVVPDVAGARDYVDDRRTGVIVPPRDPAALADALRWLLSDRDAARRIGAAGRSDVLERFGPERYVANLLAVASG